MFILTLRKRVKPVALYIVLSCKATDSAQFACFLYWGTIPRIPRHGQYLKLRECPATHGISKYREPYIPDLIRAEIEMT